MDYTLSEDDKKILIAEFIVPNNIPVLGKMSPTLSGDIFVVIPKGIKSLGWITFRNGENVFIVLLLNDKNVIYDAIIYPLLFLDGEKDVIDTLFFGTFFNCNGLEYLSCERILKSPSPIPDYKFPEEHFLLIYSTIKKIKNDISSIIMGMPVIKYNYLQTMSCIDNLPYLVEDVVIYKKNDILTNSYDASIFKVNKSQSDHNIFDIRSTDDNDIYHIYDNSTFVGIAHIPSYKSSVMMNYAFKKRNNYSNLDALEESEDEAVGEDKAMGEDEAVGEDETIREIYQSSHKMKCIYNKRFNKWQPIELL